MNWFKVPNKPTRGLPSDRVDLRPDPTPLPIPATNPPVESPAPIFLAEPQAWLKSLEPKGNPQLVALKRQLHQRVIGGLDIGSMAKWNTDTLRVEVRREAELACGNIDLEGLEDRKSVV